jgi:hypothetical protein
MLDLKFKSFYLMSTLVGCEKGMPLPKNMIQSPYIHALNMWSPFVPFG